MTLYLIGIGLSDEKDITAKGLEAVKRCDKVYLENYTSLLQVSVSDLEKFYGKKIGLANRELTEQGVDQIIEEAKTKKVAFLVVGDPLSATTHIELFKQAKLSGVEVKVINNASVLTAVGITGLQLYKFGKVTSIPFIEEHPNLETPYLVLKDNLKMGLHTLFLLDLKPEEKKFMTINQALEILEQIENEKNEKYFSLVSKVKNKNHLTNFINKHKKEKVIGDDLLVVGCARLGSEDFLIKARRLKEIKKIDFGKPPYCLIIPGKMHFIEEEMLRFWE